MNPSDRLHYEEFCRRVCEALDLSARERFGRLERMILTRSMVKCGLRGYPAPMGDPAGIRCSGQVACGKCGRPYLDHPMDWRVIGYGDVPFLNILCDGTRVKL